MNNEYCSRTSESMLQYCTGKPNNADITHSQLRKYKEKVTTNTGYAGTVMYYDIQFIISRFVNYVIYNVNWLALLQ